MATFCCGTEQIDRFCVRFCNKHLIGGHFGVTYKNIDGFRHPMDSMPHWGAGFSVPKASVTIQLYTISGVVTIPRNSTLFHRADNSSPGFKLCGDGRWPIVKVSNLLRHRAVCSLRKVYGPESRPRVSGVNAKFFECLAAEKPPRLVGVND